jgi:hypothetical protein
MRRRPLVPAIHRPAGIANPVPTLGQLRRSGPHVANSLEPPKELAVSGSAHALDHSSKLSPDIYVLRRSLECALNLLKQETITLAKVYQDSGFETEVQFVQAFCDMIGVTPTIYRENVLIAKSVAGGRTRAR